MTPSIEAAYFHRQTGLYLGGGVFICVMGAISLTLSGNGLSLIAGVVFVALGLGWRSAPVVAFGPSHVEVRHGPLSTKKLVRLSDIRAVSDDGKRLVLTTSAGDVQVPIAYLRDGDRDLVRERLSVRS